MDLRPSISVEWVNSTEKFASVAEKWLHCKVLAIDTEFERRTTYYPILALVQVYDGQNIYLIDPLEVECPLEFRQVCADANIVKVFHSAKEDLEVLLHSWECQMSGLFDTQIAHAFITGETSVGYASLLEKLLDTKIAKAETQSDWMARPLSETQLDYAATDVQYLLELFQLLNRDLENTESQRFFVAECEEIQQSFLQQNDHALDYRHAKEVWRLDAKALVLFKKLYQWREEAAIRDNRTRNHIARDAQLVQIARWVPDSKHKLHKVEGLHPRAIRLYHEEILALISAFTEAQSQASKSEEFKVVANPRDLVGFNGLTDQFAEETNNQAKRLGVAPALIASKRYLRRLSFAYLAEESFPQNWTGWRGHLLKPQFDLIFSQFDTTQ